MKAIIMLFTTSAKTDSEDFIFPNIEKVKITVDGVPNVVYSQGIPKSRFYSEAKRLFGGGVRVWDENMTIRFYKNLFALVIDLRSVEDNLAHRTGKKIVQTQSGVLIEITKLATTANVVCKTFVVSNVY